MKPNPNPHGPTVSLLRAKQFCALVGFLADAHQRDDLATDPRYNASAFEILETTLDLERESWTIFPTLVGNTGLPRVLSLLTDDSNLANCHIFISPLLANMMGRRAGEKHQHYTKVEALGRVLKLIAVGEIVVHESLLTRAA